MGVKGRMWRVMKKMYAVLLEGEKSDMFKIEQGVAQGCSLFPIRPEPIIPNILPIILFQISTSFSLLFLFFDLLFSLFDLLFSHRSKYKHENVQNSHYKTQEFAQVLMFG